VVSSLVPLLKTGVLILRCRLVGRLVMRGKRDYIEGKMREIVAREDKTGIRGTFLEQLITSMTTKTGELEVYRLTNAFLVAIFAAVHTSTTTLTSSLLELAAHPETHEILREEISAALRAHGLTLPALNSMTKLDSFMKESQRLRPLTQLSIFRIMMKPYRFCDGTQVIEGDHVAALAGPKYTDASVFTNPLEFDPWRWEKMREEGKEGTEMTDVRGKEWLLFGSGKHACPGRFFAVALSKVSLAGLLSKWSVEMAEGGRPKNKVFEEIEMPVKGRGSTVRFARLKEADA
jgi:cytochrome P450